YFWLYPPNDIYQMKIRVYSEEDLYKEMEFEVVVSKSNRKPEAKIIKNMRFGNILSIYEFDAWQSSDVENIPSELMARWDFEGDGIWDTQFDYNKKISHVYPSAGVYTATLQIKDQNDLTDMATTDIRVSQYTNPTSYLKDVRDQQMYGIVKIGTRWWMGENLKFADLKNHNTPYICYQDRAQFCEATGKLYFAGAVMTEFTGETEAKNLCPRGWHVPFKDEWLALIDEVGRETAGTALNYGGKSDFNILLGGYAYFDFDELIQDSIHRVAYFIARNSDSTLTTLQYRRDETTVQFAKIKLGYYSIRCIKDE
ncbi:MAG: FISUMP domain-containing protein, partial [Bacteroidales bacterium]|nr:FISUMP domain-containing protein [Bacteroidales bacterium]